MAKVDNRYRSIIGRLRYMIHVVSTTHVTHTLIKALSTITYVLINQFPTPPAKLFIGVLYIHKRLKST